MSRREAPEEPEADNFIVLFTALSMILLAFFIMLNSLATIDDVRSRVVIDSLVGTFGVLPGFKQTHNSLDIGNTKLAEEEERADRLLRLASSMLETGGETGVSLEKREGGRVVMGLNESFFFGSGRVHVDPASFDTLDRIVQLIDMAEMAVRVAGHTDAAPAGGEKTNWYLSAARAATVYRYLHEAGGVPATQISAHGYGSTRPDPVSGEAERRVEIVFLPDMEWSP